MVLSGNTYEEMARLNGALGELQMFLLLFLCKIILPPPPFQQLLATPLPTGEGNLFGRGFGDPIIFFCMGIFIFFKNGLKKTGRIWY